MQETFKVHMKNIASASMADLPEANLDILGTAAEQVYAPSDLNLKLIMDSQHNVVNNLVKNEPILKDYSSRKTFSSKLWPPFVENP